MGVIKGLAEKYQQQVGGGEPVNEAFLTGAAIGLNVARAIVSNGDLSVELKTSILNAIEKEVGEYAGEFTLQVFQNGCDDPTCPNCGGAKGFLGRPAADTVPN